MGRICPLIQQTAEIRVFTKTRIIGQEMAWTPLLSLFVWFAPECTNVSAGDARLQVSVLDWMSARGLFC